MSGDRNGRRSEGSKGIQKPTTPNKRSKSQTPYNRTPSGVSISISDAPNENTSLLRHSPQMRRTKTDLKISKIISTKGLDATVTDRDKFLKRFPSESLLVSSQNQNIRSPVIASTPKHELSQFDYDSYNSFTQRPNLNRALTDVGGIPGVGGGGGSGGVHSKINSVDNNDLDPNILNSSLVDMQVPMNRNYYDDFTSVDWVNDTIKESKRQHQLNKLKGWKGNYKRLLDKSQGWVLISVIAFAFSLVAYTIDRAESTLVDLKRGYCKSNWLLSESMCCLKDPSNLSGRLSACSNWRLWPEVFQYTPANDIVELDFILYILLTLVLAYLSVKITLTTKTTNPLAVVDNANTDTKYRPQRTIYSAYGSGVPEVKTILSGFIIRKFLGTYTLLAKSTALIFAIASGMSLGKEGPFVHLATCVGNIFCRVFKKFNNSGLERRQILSAAASAGVALAFGSPLGGVLFSLEEVSYYLPGNQLFRTFFCAIMSILFLRFLNPYATGKTVPFEVSYKSDWKPIEIIFFILLGIAGGVYGALFCKFSVWWGKWFRSKTFIKKHPVNEVLLIALITGLTTFSNPYTKSPISELLYDLASPCFTSGDYSGNKGLCPIDFQNIPEELYTLTMALIIKVILTSITFGIKVPAGIYVPSMVIGALFGRIFSMSIQYVQMLYPKFFFLDQVCDGTSPCIDFGIYAMIGAGAFMAGVTRMNITLSTIIFELTSSYTYVLPISISIAVSNWVAYAIEPRSLYELIIFKNDFPFLANRKLHDFTRYTELKDLINGVSDTIYIDVTNRTRVKAAELRVLLIDLQLKGMVDGCIPIIKDDRKLVGMLSAPELEFALDKLARFCEEYEVPSENIEVQLLNNDGYENDSSSFETSSILTEDLLDGGVPENLTNIDGGNGNVRQEDAALYLLSKLTDFTKIIEYSPIMLDVNSPLALIETIFTKLGNRYICILEDGFFIGFVHKKIFIDYCRDRTIL